MARSTPQETFAEAQAAMSRGDWEGVFACLDPDDLVTIANNSVARFMMVSSGPAADRFNALCAEHGIPAETLTTVRSLAEQITHRAVSVVSSDDPAAMMEESRRHHQIVLAHRAALKQLVKSAPDIARFTAALERELRVDGGGGSVSPRLFVGESLENVSIEGAKAWASRRVGPGELEDVGFRRRKSGWVIRLFAKRPR